MQYTTNYNLKKPDQTDTVNIMDLNNNADAIDTQMKANANSITNLAGTGRTTETVKGAYDSLSTHLTDSTYQTATGTGTAITITTATLVNGYAKTFIASANNGGAATTINAKSLYKPGTIAAPTLIAGKAYTVWYNQANDCFFIKASATGNTIASHVLAGDTFSNDTDTDIVGTAPLKSGITYTPTTTDQTITTGWEDGTCKVKGDANLVSANLKANTTCFGVTGKSSVVETSDATALVSQLLSGVTAYVNGTKLTGTMVNNTTDQNSIANSYLGTVLYMTPPIGYWNGSTRVMWGDANFTANNIRYGTSVFGKTGNCIPGVAGDQVLITKMSTAGNVNNAGDSYSTTAFVQSTVPAITISIYGTYRIKCAVNKGYYPGEHHYVQFAVNGVLIGSVFDLTGGTSTGDYGTCSQDYTLNIGDVITVWYKYASSGSMLGIYAQNFQICMGVPTNYTYAT